MTEVYNRPVAALPSPRFRNVAEVSQVRGHGGTSMESLRANAAASNSAGHAHHQHPITLVTDRRRSPERGTGSAAVLYAQEKQHHQDYQPQHRAPSLSALPYGQLPPVNYFSPPMSSSAQSAPSHQRYEGSSIAPSEIASETTNKRSTHLSSTDPRSNVHSNPTHSGPPSNSSGSRAALSSVPLSVITSAATTASGPPMNFSSSSNSSGHQPLLYSSTPQLPSLGQGTLLSRNYFPQRAAIPQSGLSAGPQISAIGRPTGPLRSIKNIRRGKTHVQKACVNCKRAHLSCDAQRPCARCIGSGKQDTCHDVEHKKRGRPRLRDDREARPGREIAPTEKSAISSIPGISGISASLAVQPRLPLPAATTITPAHRRAQSGRILRSHRPSVGASSRPIAAQRHTIGAGPSSSSSGFSSRAPTARVFVNMNFRILRANWTFQEQFANGAEVRGRALHEFLESRHEQDLQRLGTELRAEREQRDPMALPTIFSDQEQQAIDSIDENQIDAYVAGSAERKESWQFACSSPGPGGGPALQRPLVVQLGHVGTFAFILLSVPSSAPITLPPLPTSEQPSLFGNPTPLWEMRSPGSAYPQSASGSTTPSLSLQSLAATLPPASMAVGASSYSTATNLSRYPSSSSGHYPISPSSYGGSRRRRASGASPTMHSQPAGLYRSTTSSSAGGYTRPQSTISEPLSAASGASRGRRPTTWEGQSAGGRSGESDEPPLPSLAGALEAARLQQLLADTAMDEDGRKRRRLDINDITD